MRLNRKVLQTIILIMFVFLLAGCNQGVKEDDLKEVLKTRDIKEIATFISSYQEQKNKDELDNVVVEDFKALAESTDYSDFEYMEDLQEAITDEGLKGDLQKVLDDNAANKAIAFTEGKWVRRDYTNLDGAVIDLKWVDKKGTAILTSVSKTKDNKYGFQKGDVKWKTVEVLSENELVFEDLQKSDEDSGYNQAYATIDYRKGQIFCKVSSEKKAYENGNTQVWVKQDLIDEKKEVLKEKDFRINKEVDLNDREVYYYYFYNSDIKNDRMVDLRGSLKFKSNRSAFIKKYGYGHILYQSYKSDWAYDNAVYDGRKDYISCLKKTKYTVLYFDKEHDKFLRLYFNNKDRLIAVITGFDYDSFVKANEQ